MGDKEETSQLNAGGQWGRPFWIQAVTLLVATGLLYSTVLARLAADWWNDPESSHGPVVPLFSLFVIWHAQKKWQPLPVRPAWFGLVIVLGSLALLVTGVLGVEFFLARSSFVFMLAGLIVFFLGWDYFRAFLFPWAFLFLMIPIPAIIFNHITFPLQLLATNFSATALQLIGIPVLQEGNVIQMARTTLEVAEACSGIRSLLTLVTLAIIYGYFLETRLSRRIIFALAAIPIAVLANGLRVFGTGVLAQYWSPEAAQGFFHTFSGWLIFVIAMFLLFSVDNLLKWIDRLRGRPATTASD